MQDSGGQQRGVSEDATLEQEPARPSTAGADGKDRCAASGVALWQLHGVPLLRRT
jgi:hypothetical protein